MQVCQSSVTQAENCLSKRVFVTPIRTLPCLHPFSMAIAVSPLATHLQTLHAAANPADAASSSSSHDGQAQLEALKRIKHILIGNTNRKLELAKQKDSIAL